MFKQISSLLFLMAISFCLTSCSFFEPGPSQTVEKFYEAVENGQADVAVGLFSNRAVQTFGSAKLEQGLLQQSRKMNDQGGVQSVTILEEKVNGDIASVTVEVVMNNGQVSTENVDLIRENDKWKIDINK
jgi:hypothetical protein